MANYHKPDLRVIQQLQDLSNKLRIHTINATQASKSGHPTSCSSIAEIMSVLFFHVMRYKVTDPRDANSDRFILSKGHAAPILYAAWAETGFFPSSELLNLRRFYSDLEGHPTPRLDFVDVGTGSLGQGLSVAAGMAYVGKNFDKASYRVYSLIGDGEMAEGSIWEALNFSSFYKLDNLCAIFDINRLGQSDPTSLQHDMETYRKRLESFGFNALVVDGHDIEELIKAFYEAQDTKGRPTAILAKTFKGRNFPGIENLDHWHGKPLGDMATEVLQHLTNLLRNPDPIKLYPQLPTEDTPFVDIHTVALASPPAYKLGEPVATRFAYGTALAKLARNNARVIALDGDTKNSTYAEKIKTIDPERFIESFIAEQNMVGVAIGAACRDRTIPFVSTFAAFFTRAFDQIRMGAISQTNVNFVGSHCGISIGEDGPSQMGLEDIAMFRAIPDSTIFYPSDAVSTERAVEIAAKTKGICFIRTSRPPTAVLYSNDESFKIGEAKIIRSFPNDRILVIAAGVTLHEALSAADELDKIGINIRVMDLFTVKPLDVNMIVRNAREVGGKIITVEDHYPQGGIGEAVVSAIANQKNVTVVKRMAVSGMPRSGSSALLLDNYGISARNIIATVHEILDI
ncbi:hypothetical protein HN011_000220 [Eciton burchellii]|nr:hypothetical protein HN011_000220 [Eciton burchellii]